MVVHWNDRHFAGRTGYSLNWEGNDLLKNTTRGQWQGLQVILSGASSRFGLRSRKFLVLNERNLSVRFPQRGSYRRNLYRFLWRCNLWRVPCRNFALTVPWDKFLCSWIDRITVRLLKRIAPTNMIQGDQSVLSSDPSSTPDRFTNNTESALILYICRWTA